MNKEIRKIWAEKSLELSNIGAGVLIFGQIVSGKQIQTWAIFFGFLLIALGFAISYILLRRK